MFEYAALYVTRFDGKRRGEPDDVARRIPHLMDACYFSGRHGPESRGPDTARSYALKWRDGSIGIYWLFPPRPHPAVTPDELRRCVASFHIVMSGDVDAHQDDAEVIFDKLTEFRPVAAVDCRAGKRLDIDDIIAFYESVDRPRLPIGRLNEGLLAALDEYNARTGWKG